MGSPRLTRRSPFRGQIITTLRSPLMRNRISFSIAAAIAAMVAFAIPVAAQASSVPTASIVAGSSHIAANGSDRLSYATGGVPAGSAIYLQERVIGSGDGWSTLGRVGRNGIVTVTDIPSGLNGFRVAVRQWSQQIATSSATYVVAGSAQGSSTWGTIWDWAKRIGGWALTVWSIFGD